MPSPHSGIPPARSNVPHPALPSSHVPWSPTLCVLLESWFICGLYVSALARLQAVASNGLFAVVIASVYVQP